MNKGLFIRIGAIIAAFAVVIIIAVSCDTANNNEDEAMVSNPDTVYLTVDGIEVTKGELWNSMKNTEGLAYVQEYAQMMLLEDYINAVTDEEVDAEIQLLKYLTEDPETIQKINEDADLLEQYTDAFEQNLKVLGYDPTDEDDLRAYVELSIAKRNYTKDLVRNETDEDSSYFVTEEDKEEYYAENNFGSVCTLDIKFQDSAELSAILDSLNIVPNYGDEGSFGLYYGTTPIEDVAKADFDETNTSVLTTEEVFELYIELWNMTHPWETPIPTTTTQSEYCTNYADMATKEWNDLTDYKATSDPLVQYANYIFSTIDLNDEDVVPYTYNTTTSIGEFTMLIFKISQEDATPYADLTDEEKAENLEEMIDTAVSDSMVNSAMTELLEDNDFQLVDPKLKLSYEFSTGTEFDTEDSKTVVATLDGEDITADQLFTYMEERVGVLYSLEVARTNILINSDAYTEIYGESKDFLNNNSDKMKEHREDLLEMKSLFSANQYAQYGYSSSTMTWDEFLFLAFSMTSEEETLEKMFVVSELQFGFTFDTITYESAIAYMQDQIDNYLNLDVSHILLYVDFDNDFQPDDFSDYTDSLTAQELADFNVLKAQLENKLIEKIGDGLSLDAIVDDYTTALINDETSEWYDFKQAGLFILSENIGEITYSNVENFDEAFGDAVVRIYDAYTRAENKDLDKYTDDQVVVSDFGIHFIQAEQGDAFEVLSAKFTSEDGELGEYSDGADNTEVLPTKAQVELWLQLKLDTQNDVLSSVNLPDSVEEAIDAYFGPIYSAYTSTSGGTIALAEYALANNLEYTDNNTQNLADLETLVEVLYEINFPELFDADAE